MAAEKQILDFIKERGIAVNHVEFIATIEGEDVYSGSLLDDDGFALPTGLPMIVLSKGDNLRLVKGDEALKLCDSLPDDK